ncbi:MAG: hypothetical protein ACREKM_12930, partial [Longimicrobiales bacterium]
MRNEIKRQARIGLAVAAGLFVTAVNAQAQQPAPAPAPEACVVAIEAASVPVNAEPVTIKAAYSQDLGETITAQVPEESGIKVVSAEADAELPMTLNLTLDTSAAAAGEWELALIGDAGSCAGTLA